MSEETQTGSAAQWTDPNKHALEATVKRLRQENVELRAELVHAMNVLKHTLERIQGLLFRALG